MQYLRRNYKDGDLIVLLSILYLRCAALNKYGFSYMPVHLSILYLRCAFISYRGPVAYDTWLSILYLRCALAATAPTRAC